MNTNNKLNNNNKYLPLSIESLRDKGLLLKSVHCRRAVSFFSSHPEALPLFIDNFDLTLKELVILLNENGITNRGIPYSVSTVGVIKSFLKDIDIVNVDLAPARASLGPALVGPKLPPKARGGRSGVRKTTFNSVGITTRRHYSFDVDPQYRAEFVKFPEPRDIKEYLFDKLSDPRGGFINEYPHIRKLLDTYNWKIFSNWETLHLGDIASINNPTVKYKLADFVSKIPTPEIYTILPCVVSDGRVTTLCNQLFVDNKTDVTNLIPILNIRINMLSLQYHYTEISNVFIKYRRIESASSPNIKLIRDLKTQLKSVKSKNNLSISFENLGPLTINLKNYGKLIDPSYLSKVSNSLGSLFSYKNLYVFVNIYEGPSEGADPLHPKHNGEVYDNNYNLLYRYTDDIFTYTFKRTYLDTKLSILVDKSQEYIISVSVPLNVKKLPIRNNRGASLINDCGTRVTVPQITISRPKGARNCSPAASGKVREKILTQGSISNQGEKLESQLSNFYVLDIETFVGQNGEMTPYAIGIYTGDVTKIYYLTEYYTPEDMILAAFNDIWEAKYKSKTKNTVIYAHNFGNFDGIFLLKLLAEHFSVDPTFKESKLINLTIYKGSGRSKYRIKFLDSYLMLNSSLDTLCKDLNVKTKKLTFPHKFVTKDKLNYLGPKPGNQYFFTPPNSNVSPLVSEASPNSNVSPLVSEASPNWDLKANLVEYLTADLESLHQVLSVFQQNMSELFKVDICDFSTISGMAFYIWRYKFANHDLPIISGNLYDFIKEGYYGGINLVITPQGFNLFTLDVNSSYPSAMCNDMPVGNPIYIKTKQLDEIGFGFARVKFKTPNNLHIPILPVRTEMGIVYPLGHGEGVYFIEEVRIAQLFGYEIEVIEGYKFERGKGIFENYVNTVYDLKAKHTGVKSLIFKLLKNSLYGRMGLNENYQISKKINNSELDQILKTHKLYVSIPVGDDHTLISYSQKPDENLCKLWKTSAESIDQYLIDKDFTMPMQSISIAAATAAYARIYLILEIQKRCKDSGYPFPFGFGGITTDPRPIHIPVHKRSIQIFYLDTDSIVINNLLDPNLIGKHLGQFSVRQQNAYGIYIKKKLYTSIPLPYLFENVTIKASGLGNNITTGQIYELFKGNEVKITVNKLYKKIENGLIYSKDKIIKVQPSEIGRKKVYSEGKWVSTSPYFIKDGIIQSTYIISYKEHAIIPYQIKEYNLIKWEKLTIEKVMLRYYAVWINIYVIAPKRVSKV